MVAFNGSINPARYGWLCFHCGEHFKQVERDKAEKHFGPTPDWSPACIERKVTEDYTLVEMSRAARLQAIDLIKRVHEAEDDAEVAYLKNTGGLHRFPARSIGDAYHMYESMEGRALAAEAMNNVLKRINPVLWQLIQDEVCTPSEG